MKPKSRGPEQDDVLHPRLTDMMGMRHEPVKLAALIDWEFFVTEWAGSLPSYTGHPATSPRLVAGLSVAARRAFDAAVDCEAAVSFRPDRALDEPRPLPLSRVAGCKLA